MRPPIPRLAPDMISQNMQRCWMSRPHHRPSFDDIIQDFNRKYDLEGPSRDSIIVLGDYSETNTKLTYAKLVLKEEQLKKQYQTIFDNNSQ